MLLTSKDKVTSSYQVIVIGSGLAGLTAANVLAKQNYKVLLVEAHNKLGGLATWFYRKNKKHIFDVSLHGFPIGMIKTCKKYWNKKIADSIIQLKDIRFVNPQFNLQTTFDKESFLNILSTQFSIDKLQAEQFFQFIEKMNFYDDQQMTIGQLFEKFFPKRPDVHRLLLEPITYANGSTLEDPAIAYGIVFSNFMSKGVYTFQGGTDLLINEMKEELISNGVDIKMQTKIEKIELEKSPNGSKVKGVWINDQLISCDAIVSNANIHHTIFKLTGQHHYSNQFIEKAKKIRLNSSSCQVYMAIKEGCKIDHIGDLIFTSTYPTYDSNKLLDFNITSRTFSVYYPETRPQLESAQYAVVSSTNAHYDDWAKLSKDEYEFEKKKMVQETIESLKQFIPNIEQILDHAEAATPLTVERFTHHKNGASFGTKFEGLEVSMNLHKQVHGLFHSGSVGIIMSGWLGSANYGVIQANNVGSYLSNIEQKNENNKPANLKNENGENHYV